MAVFRDLYPLIMPYVQGCPTAIVDTAIRQSIIDFCERTLMWRYTFPVQDIVADDATYTWTTPTDSVISKPLYVAANSTQLLLTNEDDLDSQVTGWRDLQSTSSTSYFMDYEGTMHLVPKPTVGVTGGLYMEAALKPSRTATTFPDWLIDEWADVLAHGALFRLHAMPGKIWADTNSITYHRAQFRSGISRAKSRTLKSFSRQTKTVQPRSFME